MNKQTLVFNDIEVNKKDFYASKQAVPLNLVNTNNIFYRIKQNNDTYKYFIGYLLVEKTRHLKLKIKMCI